MMLECFFTCQFFTRLRFTHARETLYAHTHTRTLPQMDVTDPAPAEAAALDTTTEASPVVAASPSSKRDASTIQSSSVATKKQKVFHPTKYDSSKYSFVVCFEHLASIKQLIDVIGDVLPRVYLELRTKKDAVDGDESMMLSINTIDPQKVCIVQAQLECHGSVSGGAYMFCVDTKVLIKCLRNVPPHHSIELSCEVGKADVVVRSYDAMCNVEDIKFNLHTFDDDHEPMPELEEFTYGYETEMEMPTLKRIVKLADQLNCENLCMSMHSAKVGNVTHAVTEFSGDADAGFSRAFPSCVLNDQTSADRSAGETVKMDVSKMKLEFNANFALEYLNKFVKAMEHQMVNLKFGKDPEGNDLPLLIHYPLGVPNSHVRFLLAPKAD